MQIFCTRRKKDDNFPSTDNFSKITLDWMINQPSRTWLASGKRSYLRKPSIDTIVAKNTLNLPNVTLSSITKGFSLLDANPTKMHVTKALWWKALPDTSLWITCIKYLSKTRHKKLLSYWLFLSSGLFVDKTGRFCDPSRNK